MRNNKVGVAFMVSMLALAGIGITYAGWTDVITVSGMVENGDVDIDIVKYSGTWIWKTINDHGLVRNHYKYDAADLVYNLDSDDAADDHLHQAWYNDPANYLEVASAWAEPCDTMDETGDYDGVELFFDNLFPCQDFTVDFILHYEGSIPARLQWPIMIDTNDGTGTGGELPDDFKGNTDGYDWLEYLWYVETNDANGVSDGGIGVKAYYTNADGSTVGEDIVAGSQFEYCDYIYVELTIHIPQDNDYQNLKGGFTTEFEVIQYDMWGEET